MSVEIEPEALLAAGQACQGLGEAIKAWCSVSKTGATSPVHELTNELLRISKSISWQLRTDRDKWSDD